MCNSRKAILKKALPIALLIGSGATATLNAQNQTDKVSTEQTIVNNGEDKNLLSNTYTIDSLTSDTLTKTSAKQSEAMTAAQTNTEQNKHKTSPLGLLTMALGAIFTTGMGALLFSKSSKNTETKEKETSKADTNNENNQIHIETIENTEIKEDKNPVQSQTIADAQINGDNMYLNELLQQMKEDETFKQEMLKQLQDSYNMMCKEYPDFNFRINYDTLSIEVVEDEKFKEEQQKRVDAFCELLKEKDFNYTMDENFNIDIKYERDKNKFNNLENTILRSKESDNSAIVDLDFASGVMPMSNIHDIFTYTINGIAPHKDAYFNWFWNERKHLQVQDACRALTELKIPYEIDEKTGKIEIEGKYINPSNLDNYDKKIMSYFVRNDWVYPESVKHGPYKSCDVKLLDLVENISGDIDPMNIPKEYEISKNSDGSGTITTPLKNVVRVEHILGENDNGSAPYDNLVNTIKNLNINLSEAQIKQAFAKGINRSDVLKFYNLFSDEDKKVRGELANTFIKEWILDGITYNDLDKFLNLPYCQDFADSGEASVFTTDDRKRYAQGTNAELLTKHFNIKDMIYLSESKNLNLQYIYVIMDLINTKQIKLEDIKNMDKDELRKFCNQFDKSRGSDLWQLEEYLFCSCPKDINWEKILSDKKYNDEHSISSMPIRKIVSENPAFAGDPEMQRLINALLG